MRIRRDFPYGRYELKIETTSFRLADYQAQLAEKADAIAAFLTQRNKAFHEEMARWRANGQFTFEEPVPEAAESAELKENEYSIDSPVAGSVWQWQVNEGEHIDASQVVALVESMKMEIEIRASRGGVVTRLLVHEGSTVSAGQPLLIIAASQEEPA